MMYCPVCQSNANKLFIQVHDDRYGYPGVFDIIKCTDCKHMYLDADFTASMLSNLYSSYYPRSEWSIDDYSPYVEVSDFKAWINGLRSMAHSWIPRNVKILDIGCGFGEALGYHKSRGCLVQGVESDENITKIAEKYGFQVHVGLFDPEKYEDDFFDYVTMNQVIEHMTCPITILQGISKILKPGGSVVITTPNVHGVGASLFRRRWIHWHAPYHLQFFSIQSMTLAAKSAGLTIRHHSTVTHANWLLYQMIHFITIPDMNEPSSFWKPKSTPSLTSKLIMGLKLTLIPQMLTMLGDAVDSGDNSIYILRKE